MKETKYVERLPDDQGAAFLRSYPAVKTPWGKMYDWHFATSYTAREVHVIACGMMAALRCLIPDYAKRAELMCKANYEVSLAMNSGPAGQGEIDRLNMHPFCRGNFMGCLIGDTADESLYMTGRVNDFGSYRVEKELDTCPWDIVGSEICRCTVVGFQGLIDGVGNHQPRGPRIDMCMVEALGCGDLHCRIIGEDRRKYPLPEAENKPIWQSFGPVATADLAKYTPEEEQHCEPAMFRSEADYAYVSGTNGNYDANSALFNMVSSAGENHLQITFAYGIEHGYFTAEEVKNAVKACCEAVGKGAYGPFFAKAGVRDFLGVPRQIADDDDARILGGLIEMFLQCKLMQYDIEKFDSEEAIYVFNWPMSHAEHFMTALLAYWNGCAKTLLSAKWALWEENSPENRIRIKLARKIDKFC